MYTWASCSGENRNRPTCLQTAGFEFLDYTAINLKRPKVTGGEVGVSSDTIRLGLKQSSLGGTFYPNVSKNHKIQLIFTESISFFEYWRRSRLERVPALTVTLPVLCSLIIPDHERRALFLLSSNQFGNL